MSYTLWKLDLTSKKWFWNCIISVITPYLVAERPDSAKLGSNIFFMWGGLCCISCKFSSRSHGLA
jgi:hypothetical protein